MTGRAAGRLVVAVLLALAGLAGTSGAAQAHTGLEGSTPADGATVTSLPAPVRLRFADPVLTGTAAGALTGPDGPVDLPAPKVRGSVVTFVLPQVRTPGRHRLAWRVVAEDGHPVTGVLTLQVSRRAVAAAAPTPTPTTTPAGATVASAAPTPTPTPAATSGAPDAAAAALAATESVGSASSGAPGGPATGWAVFGLLVALAVVGPGALARRRRPVAVEGRP